MCRRTSEGVSTAVRGRLWSVGLPHWWLNKNNAFYSLKIWVTFQAVKIRYFKYDQRNIITGSCQWKTCSDKQNEANSPTPHVSDESMLLLGGRRRVISCCCALLCMLACSRSNLCHTYTLILFKKEKRKKKSVEQLDTTVSEVKPANEEPPGKITGEKLRDRRLRFNQFFSLHMKASATACEPLNSNLPQR